MTREQAIRMLSDMLKDRGAWLTGGEAAIAALQAETPAPSSAWFQHQVLPTLESEKCRQRDGGYCSNWAEYSNGKTLRCAQHIPDPQVMLDEQWIKLPERYRGPKPSAPQETP